MSPKTGKGQGAVKMNKESHLIKKSSVSKPQQRQPVIIYTHSPRVIQTHPSNFMELVQKLTGLCRSHPDDIGGGGDPPRKEEPEENEAASSSVITEELDGCNCVGEVKSSFVALEPPVIPDYVNVFGASDFLCSSKASFNLADPSLFFSGPCMEWNGIDP